MKNFQASGFNDHSYELQLKWHPGCLSQDMKETTFCILLNLKTVSGFESFGKFMIGNSRETAFGLFSQLKGSRDVNEGTVLTIELLETVNNLPVNMEILGCTLNELADNCKIITRETFKLLNLEQLR